MEMGERKKGGVGGFGEAREGGGRGKGEGETIISDERERKIFFTCTNRQGRSKLGPIGEQGERGDA